MTLTAPPETAAAEQRESLWARIDRGDLARTLLVAACAAAVALGLTWPWPPVPLVAVIGLVVGCWPIAAEALGDLRERRMSMELSMLIAIVAAAAIGEWTTALVISTFVLAAEILEDLSLDRGRDALTDLMSFLPDQVQVRDGDRIRTVPLEEARAGQVVVVSPGGRVPVDGTVLSGRSTADQSRITGEPLPVDLGPGDRVHAGSINQIGAVEIRAERVGAESSYGRIIEAVRRAQSSEPPVQRLADRMAAALVYLALGGAAVTYLVTRDLTATISVVVVAGACGIAAGTPLAALAAIARIARGGAFVKDGAHLEALSAIDTVVLDKTGTLTLGAPRLVDVRPSEGWDAPTLLELAASAEAYSEHPLAAAIRRGAEEQGLSPAVPDSFTYTPGLGVRAEVGGRTVTAGSAVLVPGTRTIQEDPAATAVPVAVDGRFAGSLLLADGIRPGASEAIAQLHRMGLRTMIVTGDRPETAQAVAAQLGIDAVRAGLLPEEKLDWIDQERARGHRIAMVGDGVNDAPALARADVGIAMGDGTQIAQDSADVVLVSSDLDDLVHTVAVARRARRIVLANFAGTIAIDLLGMLLAALGLLSPVVAALVHVGSETAFILNSARLIPGRGARRR